MSQEYEIKNEKLKKENDGEVEAKITLREKKTSRI